MEIALCAALRSRNQNRQMKIERLFRGQGSESPTGVTGERRVSILWLGTLLLAGLLPQEGIGQKIYFPGSEIPGIPPVQYESYVLPLSKPEDIAHARDLIASGASASKGLDRPIVVARIAPGSNDINRNWLDPSFPEWSWHVEEFLQFADFTAEILDGRPSLPPEGDRIGFWSYTVVKELGPVPLYLSVLKRSQGLDVYWSGLGTNYLYSLQSTESLPFANWTPVAGAVWPLKTNHWTIPGPAGPARYFRVQAQP
jgi:hypothetical protein